MHEKLARVFSELPLNTVTLMSVSFILGGAFAIIALVLLEYIRRSRSPQKED